MGGKGPPRPSSSESDDWGDESWIVDCPCGVNYDDGEEMVECDECGVWVHTSCCRVTKGLPTYVCDKCKIKKKLKESEESEVAQLLADLPSKGVSFEERRHGKGGGLISGHLNSSEIPIEDRAHVHGIPGGDPSFFVGAPDVFCRQLWKYSGYVPKLLKLEYKELPEPREEVLELLRDLKVCEVPMFFDTDRRVAPLALENGHAAETTANMCNSREEEVSKIDAQGKEETPNDKQGKSLQVRKSEGKHNKHKHKPKGKEDKPRHHVKRARDEGGLKEQSSKKKLRANGDVHKLEGGDVLRADVSPSEDASLLSKSPLSSPKNPKAMKKMAVQEFMDGDMILCSVCGKVESPLDGTTGASSGGDSDSFCQECAKLRRRASPLSSKQETGSVKQEPGVVPVPAPFESGVAYDVKSVSKTEVDYCEVGTEAQWVRLRADTRKDAENQTSADGDQQGNLRKSKVDNDSPTESKKVDVEVTSHKTTGIYEYSKGRDEKRNPSVKVEPPNGLTVNHPSVITRNGEFPVALELPAVRTIVAAKAPGESAAKAEDLRQDGAHVVASRALCADDAETRTAGDTGKAVSGNKQAVPVEGHLPVGSSDISSKTASSTRVSGTIPLVPGIPGPVMPEPVDGKDSPGTSLPGRVVPAVVTETVEDKVSKVPPSSMSMETKSQGSARTAGHLPASVRGKMHGERGMYLQRSISHAAVQTQASALSDQPLVQVPFQVHSSVAMLVSPSTKGSSGQDSVSGKYNGQVQQKSISPVGQGSRHGQPSRLHIVPAIVAQKSPAGLSETLSPSQPPPSAQRTETDQQQPPSKMLPKGVEPSRNESHVQAVSPKEPKVASGFSSDTQVSKPTGSTQVTPTPVFCQQARQLNGIGHVYVSRKSLNKDPSGTLTSQPLNSTVSNKLSASSLKSPSSGTSSSSPTSPLVTTPSSKPQPSVKVTESLQTHKSLPGGSIPNASAPHSSSKLSGPVASTVSSSKQVGTLQSLKSIPSPASPPSTKGLSMSKQTARSNSLPVTKHVDGNNIVSRSSSGVMSSRGLNNTGSASSVSAKENAKNFSHTSSKIVSKATAQPAGTKPPSSGKSSHSVAPTKGLSGSKHHSGIGSGTSKSTLSANKHTSSHHSKSGTSHKDEKSSMPSAPPIPKAMATMPPPPPQVSTKRSPPTGLTSAVATTLKDEELAMLLHQELNSSPRVPRIPRVRQAGASLQLVSSPSFSSAKGSFGSYGSGGPSHKDHHPAPRKRTREDRHKDAAEEVSKTGRKRSEESRMDDEKVSSERAGHNGAVEGLHSKEKSAQGSGEGNSRHHGFAKGNLSIIVPTNDDPQDGDKKSPAHSNVLTLPGLIDEVLSSRDHQLSYEDVCEAVLPHWPKLRKPNGERYAYPSHRQAVLDCLRNRPAWAHLVGRGPKTISGRKRRRNEIKSLSDSDEEENEQVGFRDSDDLDTGKYSKRRKELDRDKRTGDALEKQKNSDAEDVRKVGRPARRRRRVDIDDGTDGEDEPTNATEKTGGRQPEVCKSDDETSQEEEPEADFSPSSEEEDEASNYSTDDEEMVVHRGIRNRRRRTEESSSSEDDVD